MVDEKLLDSPAVFVAERRGSRHQRQHTIVLQHSRSEFYDGKMINVGGITVMFGSSAPGGMATYSTKIPREVELLNLKCEKGFINGIRVVNLTKIQESVGGSPAGMEQIQELAQLAPGDKLDKIAEKKGFESFTGMLSELTRADANEMIGKLKAKNAARAENEQQNAKELSRQKKLQSDSKVARTTMVKA